MSDFLQTLLLTGKMATITTIILFCLGLPLAYWLVYSRFKLKFAVEALLCMPLVLPPTVMGYYFLILLSPNSLVGSFFQEIFGFQLAFTFQGIVLASVVANLPFMVQPLQNGLSALPDSLREVSYTMGKTPLQTFFRVLLPNIKPSIITGIALTFAHCIGEFGIVLMVGGSIPKETRIASIEIYDEVQSLNYEVANQYSLVLFAISFFILIIVFSVNKNFKMGKF